VPVEAHGPRFPGGDPGGDGCLLQTASGADPHGTRETGRSPAYMLQGAVFKVGGKEQGNAQARIRCPSLQAIVVTGGRPGIIPVIKDEGTHMVLLNGLAGLFIGHAVRVVMGQGHHHLADFFFRSHALKEGLRPCFTVEGLIDSAVFRTRTRPGGRLSNEHGDAGCQAHREETRPSPVNGSHAIIPPRSVVFIPFIYPFSFEDSKWERAGDNRCGGRSGGGRGTEFRFGSFQTVSPRCRDSAPPRLPRWVGLADPSPTEHMLPWFH